jgi:Flp pilus assembly pilin Flp
MHDFGSRLWHSESGQGLSEYALLLAAVVALSVAVASVIGGEAGALLARIATYITDNNPTD